MKFKTRNNFFMKYDIENKQARIKLLRRNYQLKLSELNYKKFKQIVYSFVNQPAEIPEDWEKNDEYYSYLKAAMKIGLIYIFKVKRLKYLLICKVYWKVITRIFTRLLRIYRIVIFYSVV